MNTLQNQYARLDKISKSLLQLLAFQHSTANHYSLSDQATKFGLRQSNGRALTQSFVRDSVKKWAAAGILTDVHGRPAPALMDTLVRDGVCGDDSNQLLAIANPTDRWVRRDTVLDFFVAFYKQDADAWNTARRQIPDGSVPLLSPFCQKTYQRLTPEMRSGYFSFVIPAWIVEGQSDPDALNVFRQLLGSETSYPVDLLPRLLEWALASGDRALLERIRLQTGR